ncbi:electron transfer flavoprotein beta subunit [Microbacterium endophyticum]|uniref:Electron transfer flavoprotein subunit beta n=1 Tax=Microbacterium endophyticum TaxID=1526412 RepID=A0A7W4YMS0_9MICO|nr:electron transfer flavoprotein subunit beta/FixA family protein [Microbacterium endophyticum]MBB2975789.1 electron transfer flavoprotein beta subunit [Microbacterium endophyticum]NIK36272.1 electron transfer flavoprotein beta subunit [Microbacterium endophyticum]
MKIVVLVKEVPDTYGDRVLNMETGLADRGASETVIDEIGERALEVALTHAESTPGTEVVVMSMAPESAATSVRKALAMGAASAVHIADDTLRGADLTLSAEVLAAALTRTGFDLVITGNQSTDGSGGVMASMLSELLDVPGVTSLNSVAITDGAVSGERAIDGGTMDAAASLPAVISITERLPDARFPNFKGIMAAKKKPVEVLTLADLEINPEDFSVPRAIMTAISEKPPRSSGTTITDEGDAGEKLAAYLIENRLV